MATIVDALAPSTMDKVFGNLKIVLKSISTYVIAAATALLWWWLGLSPAEQAAKLADYPTLLAALPIVTPALIFISRLLPQKAVTKEVLKQVEQNANVTIIPGAPPSQT